MPPTRFRVIERDRRLVVIDTVDGAPARGNARVPIALSVGVATKLRDVAESAGLSLPTRSRFDGTMTLTTAGWYDDNGPRAVTLDPGAVQMVKVAAGAIAAVFVMLAVLAPGLLFTPLTLLLPGVAKPVRERVTAWLDRYAE